MAFDFLAEVEKDTLMNYVSTSRGGNITGRAPGAVGPIAFGSNRPMADLPAIGAITSLKATGPVQQSSKGGLYAVAQQAQQATPGAPDEVPRSDDESNGQKR